MVAAPLTASSTTGRRGVLVALVGCDGSGKSTLSRQLIQILNHPSQEGGGLVPVRHPVRYGYLGQGSGDLGRKIAALPGVGGFLEKRIATRAKKARTKGAKIPGFPTALVVFAFSLLRFKRFLKVRQQVEKGDFVITDRYPQQEVPGHCDGPGLSAGYSRNPFVRGLAALERAWYGYMTSFKPDLVIFLDVDAERAVARKPDHDLEALRTKAAIMPQLRFRGAARVVLDARKPLSEVRKAALEALMARGLIKKL
ncbi:hypothetical protein E3E12_04065 [Formicincola oecophyllae]|uniref:Thymidylate kinase n=2 Tax=Formicincola oecophyllae TaxID=2558361 RepID=A0A4Y6UAM7_9PROT|nr:hypothetical protein E3E12_04065 [Formicincola oecophyllae]